MPRVRLFGNAVLSFMTKFSSGYWDLFDPTNGYTAIHRDVAKHLPLDKISRRYFLRPTFFSTQHVACCRCRYSHACQVR